MDFQSEHGQDFWLYNNIFHNKTCGVFVEFGAIDGILHSNSLFFEKHCGFSGLCVEPNLYAFEKLKANRQCHTLNCAVGDRNAVVEFESFQGGLLGWSGVREYIEKEHRTRIDKFIPKQNQKIIEVPMRPLNDILEEYKLYNVDYMTLDTEGSEFPILKAFDFDKFNVKVFDIENNFFTHPIEELMNSKGFKRIMRLTVNDIYVKR